MSIHLRPYKGYIDSGQPWIGKIPEHWKMERAKPMFQKLQLPVNPADDVVTCFRDGMVTLRKNRRTSGFTESIKEIGYQGIRRGNLVIHAMDAFAGAIGVSDSDGKCTPIYAVCEPKRPLNVHFYAYLIREMAQAQYIVALSRGIRERSTDFRYDTFAALPFPVLPLDEQDAIVRFIRYIDQRVNRLLKTKRRLIELLNEQKQAIIYRAVNSEVETSAPSSVQATSNQSASDRYRERRAVGQLFYIGRGEVTSHEYIAENPGPYPLYSSQTSNDGIMGYIDSYMFDGDYLTWTTDGAHAGTVFYRTGRFNCTNVCGTLKPKTRMFLPFMRYATGVETKPHVRIDINPKLMNNMMARIRVNFPAYDDQVVIYEHLEAELEKIAGIAAKAQAEIDLIREYRTRLVSDVVTGQLDVRGLTLPEVEDEVISLGNEGDELDAGPDEDGEGAEE